ncbi:hypothetical protein Goshw_020982 [Gossypium schwendimanii]|uniref:MULE transposase domain-containing protein n=1 Tax=Gossypium schwendimanii TaxID=34291 RepID=A0A7J9MCZ9_GOSSC|nr:hypothetical protein [Gossypium schwendimanii]
MLTYFNEPSAVRLQSNLTVIYDDTSTIAMLDVWVKFKEIELYVEHEVDNPIIADKNFLLTTGEGDVEEVEVDREGDDEGVESDGEGDLEKVESGGEGEVGEVQADGEGVSTTGIEVDEDIGMESGGHISLGPTVGEDNYSEVAVNEYAGDFATSNGVDNVADEYAGDFATSDRLDNVTDVRSGEEEGGNETEDGKQFKSAIRKYSKECRRQLKFIKNESKRVVVRSKMPRSTIKMVVQRVTADSLPHFKRYYVCFDALTRGWIAAVVEVECTDSWAWFLSLLSTDLGLEDGYGYTIISDQQMASKYTILSLIMKCTNEREWEDLCSALEKKDKDAYDNLMKKSPNMWTRAFLGSTCKSNIVDNNLCEAFNSSIVEARFKSIIRMLEDIRTKMITSIVQKMKLCNGWKKNYDPLVKAKFNANKKDCVG